MLEQTVLTAGATLYLHWGFTRFLHRRHMDGLMDSQVFDQTSSLPTTQAGFENTREQLELTSRRTRGVLGALGLLVAGGAALGAVMAEQTGNFETRNNLWAVAVGTAMGAANDLRFSLNLTMPIFRRNTVTA